MTDALGYIFQHYLGHIILAITLLLAAHIHATITTCAKTKDSRHIEAALKNLQINIQTNTDLTKKQKRVKKQGKPKKESCAENQFFGFLNTWTKALPSNCKNCDFIRECCRKEELHSAVSPEKPQEKKEDDIEKTMEVLVRSP